MPGLPSDSPITLANSRIVIAPAPNSSCTECPEKSRLLNLRAAYSATSCGITIERGRSAAMGHYMANTRALNGPGIRSGHAFLIAAEILAVLALMRQGEINAATTLKG